MGCLTYADHDTVLLSPLQRMIDKCLDFAKDNVQFDKSAMIAFVKSRFVSVVDPQLGIMLLWN